MPRLRRAATIAAAILASIGGLGVAQAPQALAAPNFQMPFPCQQTWSGNSGSSAHRNFEIDFNRGASSGADLGDTVVAAAGGTVTTSRFSTTSGYGNYVVIDHGGGWSTYYAHLNRRAVTVGDRVLRGQAIGAVGNTTATHTGMTPHLHYEVRSSGTITRATFNGRTFGYPTQSVTSKNCDTGVDSQELCGEGFEPNDSRALGTKGVVVLSWNQATRKNCVVTLRWNPGSTPVPMMASLQARGEREVKDSGRFAKFAGPVRAVAPGCVMWGGSIETTRWVSDWSHC